MIFLSFSLGTLNLGLRTLILDFDFGFGLGTLDIDNGISSGVLCRKLKLLNLKKDIAH